MNPTEIRNAIYAVEREKNRCRKVPWVWIGVAVCALIMFAALATGQTVLTFTFGESSTGGTTTWTIAVSDADAVFIKDALAARAGWTATVLCTQALVDAGDCTLPQLGTQVTNPETYNAAVKRSFREVLTNITQNNEMAKWEGTLTPPTVIGVDN